MKFEIIDLLGEKYHTEFDISILRLFDNHDKSFFGSEYQKSKIELEKFTKLQIYDKCKPLKKGKLKRVLSGLYNICNTFNRAEKNSFKIITGFENVSLGIYSLFFKRRVNKSIVIVHNNLTLINRVYKKKSLLKVFKVVKNVVFLDESIKEIFIYENEEFSRYKNKFIVVPHHIKNEETIVDKKKKKNLLFIGRVSIDKGGELLLRTLREISIDERQYVKIIGQVDPVLQEKYKDIISEIDVEDDFVSSKRYDIEIAKAKFVLALHDPEIFKYRVSGILFDAIGHGIPVLCSNYNLYKNLFVKYGNIGKIMNEYNISELKRIINESIKIEVDSEEYKNYYKRICDIRTTHSIDMMKLSLNNIFEGVKL